MRDTLPTQSIRTEWDYRILSRRFLVVFSRSAERTTYAVGLTLSEQAVLSAQRKEHGDCTCPLCRSEGSSVKFLAHAAGRLAWELIGKRGGFDAVAKVKAPGAACYLLPVVVQREFRFRAEEMPLFKEQTP